MSFEVGYLSDLPDTEYDKPAVLPVFRVPVSSFSFPQHFLTAENNFFTTNCLLQVLFSHSVPIEAYHRHCSNTLLIQTFFTSLSCSIPSDGNSSCWITRDLHVPLHCILSLRLCGLNAASLLPV